MKNRLIQTLIPVIATGIMHSALASDVKLNGEVELMPNRASLELLAQKSFSDNFNCHIFNANEKDFDSQNTFSLLREQCNYKLNNNLQIGGALRQFFKDGTTTSDAGVTATYSNKNNNSLSVLNIRYFPENKRGEIYGFHKTNEWFFDVLGAAKDSKGFIRFGINKKLKSISDNLYLGIETNYNITGSDIKETSTNLRASYMF